MEHAFSSAGRKGIFKSRAVSVRSLSSVMAANFHKRCANVGDSGWRIKYSRVCRIKESMFSALSRSLILASSFEMSSSSLTKPCSSQFSFLWDFTYKSSAALILRQLLSSAWLPVEGESMPSIVFLAILDESCPNTVRGVMSMNAPVKTVSINIVLVMSLVFGLIDKFLRSCSYK